MSDIEPESSVVTAPTPQEPPTPMRRKKRQRPPEPHWPWFLAGAVFGILLLASVQSYSLFLPPWAGLDKGALGVAAPRATTAPSGGESEGAVDTSKIQIRDANAIGPANARVTVIEYADFQCPFCERAYGTVKQIISAYGSQQVRVVYKHLAFLGQESVDAAVASECAADQGKFWPYHDYLFEHQGGENAGAFSKANLAQFAQSLGLDMARFTPCLQNNETLARVQADNAEARGLSFNGTPSFLVNGKPLIGAQPFDAFKQLIDAGLQGD